MSVTFSEDTADRLLRAMQKVERWSAPRNQRQPAPRSVQQPENVFAFRNDDTQSCPTAGILQVSEAAAVAVNGGQSVVLKVKQPNADPSLAWCVNNGADVAKGKLGTCSLLIEPTRVLYDSASTPQAGELWGPKTGSFKVHKGYSGFRILGDVDTKKGTVRVIPDTLDIHRRVLVRNDAGETIPAYGVLRPTGVVTYKGLTTITVAKPSTTLSRYYLFNGPNTIDNGKYGWATQDSPAFALYDTGNTPAFGEGWGPKPSEWKLFKNYPGCTIVGGHTDGRVYVQLAEINTLMGKLDGSLSVGSTATVSIWIGAGGSESDSTINVTARDWFMKAGATAIASGKKVKIEFLNGVWYVTQAECA